MRDWISARNVWLSTVGSPPRVRSRSLRVAVAARRDARRVERDQRIDADDEVGALVEQQRRVHGAHQRAVDVGVTVDRDRRVQARQRGARLDRAGDRDVLEARLAEPHRIAAVELGRDDVEAAAQLAEVVRAAVAGKELREELLERPVVAQPGRQQAAERVDRLGPVLARIAQVLHQDVGREARHAADASQELAEGRAQEQARAHRVFDRRVVDEHDAHVRRVDAVRESGGDHRARAHADVHVEVGEIDAFERLGDRVQRADLVEGAERSAARERQAESLGAGPGPRGSRLQVEHDDSCLGWVSDRRPRPCASRARGLRAGPRRPRRQRLDVPAQFLDPPGEQPDLGRARHADLVQRHLHAVLDQGFDVVPGLGGLVARAAEPRLHAALCRFEYAPHLAHRFVAFRRAAGLAGRRSRACSSCCVQPWGHLEAWATDGTSHLFSLKTPLLLHCVNPMDKYLPQTPCEAGRGSR